MNVILQNQLLASLKKLNEATSARDLYEIDYELEKSRLTFSAETNECSNQTQRDAKVTLLLDEKGMYRKFAELKSDARMAYYEWSTFKALLEDK